MNVFALQTPPPLPGGGLALLVGREPPAEEERRLRSAVRLPADIYMVTGGALMSYAPNLVDQLRRAAGYVDRILKGRDYRRRPNTSWSSTSRPPRRCA